MRRCSANSRPVPAAHEGGTAYCAQVVEPGPASPTIHKPNKCIDVAELDTLQKIYAALLSELSSRLSCD